MWSVIGNRFLALLILNRVLLQVMPSQPLRLQYLLREFFERATHNRTICCRGMTSEKFDGNYSSRKKRCCIISMNEVASFHAKENKIFEFICEAKK